MGRIVPRAYGRQTRPARPSTVPEYRLGALGDRKSIRANGLYGAAEHQARRLVVDAEQGWGTA